MNNTTIIPHFSMKPHVPILNPQELLDDLVDTVELDFCF